MSCGTRGQDFCPGDPDGARLLRSSLLSNYSLTETANCWWPRTEPLFGSRPRRPACVCSGLEPHCRTSRCARPQPTPSPGYRSTDFTAGYCITGTATAVLLPGSSSLPGLARSRLREKHNPTDTTKSTLSDTDFRALEDKVIRLDRSMTGSSSSEAQSGAQGSPAAQARRAECDVADSAAATVGGRRPTLRLVENTTGRDGRPAGRPKRGRRRGRRPRVALDDPGMSAFLARSVSGQAAGWPTNMVRPMSQPDELLADVGAPGGVRPERSESLTVVTGGAVITGRLALAAT